MQRSRPTCWFWLPLGLLVWVALATGQDSTGPGIWTEAEWQRARSLSPLPEPPPNPTNALADNIEAARLGHRLFFDAQLSPHEIWCGVCHRPHWGFTDGIKVANTIAPVKRNAMTILNAGHYRWLTWDGARDSLWHQAVGPIESPQEMGSSRLHVVKAVMRQYGPELGRLVEFPEGWEALWPGLPESGRPGEPAYDDLSEQEKRAVNEVFTSILKVIGAYERRIVSGTSPFDRFVAGDETALSESAQRGFQHFLRFGCDVCHNTPLFSDDEFHNLGLASEATGDLGRYEGLEKLKQSAFRGTGAFADAEPWVRPEDYRTGETLKGAFRTPSLRELKWTAPYGHNGSIATLEEWLDHYVAVTTGRKSGFIGQLDDALPTLQLTEKEKKELVAFMLSLSSDFESEWTRAKH